MRKVEGPARDWLSAHRDELNGRFRAASRRWPAIEGRAVLDLAAEVLPPLANGGDGDLLSAVYDLVLLHSGRGTIALPGVALLLRDAFPKLRPVLSAQPHALPASLSNAVEHMGKRGEELAAGLAAAAPFLSTQEQVEALAVLLAWRLGEARLRGAALEGAKSLPDRAVLDALRLSLWPDEAAPLAIGALEGDAWRRPEEAFRSETLESLRGAKPALVESLRRSAATPPEAPLDAWAGAGSVGDFAGFDGMFEEPPLLLDAGKERSRHRFLALTGAGAWRLDADTYGWTCRPDPAAAALPVNEPKARGKLAALLRRGDDGFPRLAPDGTLSFGGETRNVPEMAGATSYASTESVCAWTIADSHRIRVFVPRAEPL